ncbi:hypothetical protein [Sphingomonas sp.]|jgi:hypothetical protein|uniref:hypothetical protein n=1 Tax=Sphingomonas sp. TaxID=28214 RepID=UPI002ED7C9C5
MGGFWHIAAMLGALTAVGAQEDQARIQAKARWTVAAQTAAQSFLVLVDPAARVAGKPELRKLKMLMLANSAPAFHGIKVGSENDWEFNCVARTWRWVASRQITRDGIFFIDTWMPTEWKPAEGGAIGYLSGFACGDTKPIGPEYPGIKAAIDALTKIDPK